MHHRARFKGVPTRVNLVVMDMYIISGSKLISALFKEQDLHAKAYKELPVQNMFSMPKKTLAFWLADDSGINLQPHPDSRVPAEHRIDYLEHAAVAKLLTGPGLEPFKERFTTRLTEQLLANDSVGHAWTEFPDLFTFVREEITRATLVAFCGTQLLSLNPSFVYDFWQFDEALPILAQQYPRWLFPGPYRYRDRCLEAVKTWHKHIAARFDDVVGKDPHWNQECGVPIIRERHEMWSKMPGMNEDSDAAHDLGLIWA